MIRFLVETQVFDAGWLVIRMSSQFIDNVKGKSSPVCWTTVLHAKLDLQPSILLIGRVECLPSQRRGTKEEDFVDWSQMKMVVPASLVGTTIGFEGYRETHPRTLRGVVVLLVAPVDPRRLIRILDPYSPDHTIIVQLYWPWLCRCSMAFDGKTGGTLLTIVTVAKWY